MMKTRLPHLKHIIVSKSKYISMHYIHSKKYLKGIGINTYIYIIKSKFIMFYFIVFAPAAANRAKHSAIYLHIRHTSLSSSTV